MRALQAHRFEAGLYFVVCQTGWFVCVLGGAHRAGWLGVLFAACVLAWHLKRVPAPWREARLVAVTVAIGLGWESLVVDAGLLTYPSGHWINGLAPYWLCALWALFAIQFNVVYAWLRGHVVWAALLGAIAGPLSFRAGAALGAVHVERPVAAWVTLGIGWALLLPGLLRLAQHWDGVASSDSPTSQPRSTTSLQ